MKNPFLMYLAWGGAVVLGGLLGGLNFMWAHQGHFPVYGYGVDVALLAVLITLMLYVRRERSARADEFAVVKKRTAATAAIMFGFITYGLGTIARGIFAGPYTWMLDRLPGKDDAFILGLTLGMAPFAVGMLFGLVFVWRKYG
jgi:hypothetical protein